jgi:hypothetical protein
VLFGFKSRSFCAADFLFVAILKGEKSPRVSMREVRLRTRDRNEVIERFHLVRLFVDVPPFSEILRHIFRANIVSMNLTNFHSLEFCPQYHSTTEFAIR